MCICENVLPIKKFYILKKEILLLYYIFNSCFLGSNPRYFWRIKKIIVRQKKNTYSHRYDNRIS